MQRINQLILNEYSYYPKAQLVDYYKLFFQANFGAEHFIADKITAEKKLRKELEQFTFSNFSFWQNIGHKTPIYRISLQLIKDNVVTFDRFLNAFLNSNSPINSKVKNEWKDEWQKIQKTIFTMNLPLKNVETDLEKIQTGVLDFTSVHHSEIYKKQYNPHYRIVTEKEINRL
ncbi:MAG: hypothetical protein HN952_05220 [Candidatus Cloacimonetes bacterium]|nr:hypothetical protein [Candidatus Cloacimonadota bacterium]MBT6994341.1 hypothetical protein [Candidatus Cloacimonadota bacterium]MBT7469295.1 hypothetical protein [Candidatus Cloacimonadota bacterium]